MHSWSNTQRFKLRHSCCKAYHMQCISQYELLNQQKVRFFRTKAEKRQFEGRRLCLFLWDRLFFYDCIRMCQKHINICDSWKLCGEVVILYIQVIPIAAYTVHLSYFNTLPISYGKVSVLRYRVPLQGMARTPAHICRANSMGLQSMF